MNKADPWLIEQYLNQDKGERQAIKVTEVEDLGNGYLKVNYHESFEDAQVRWQAKEMMENSYHSGIVSDMQSSEKCAAHDMAVGMTNIEKDRDIMKRKEENNRLFQYLVKMADWRMIDDKEISVYAPWIEDDLKDDFIGSIITDNIKYFNTGKLPKSLDRAIIPSLVISETFVYTWEHQCAGDTVQVHVPLPNPKIR